MTTDKFYGDFELLIEYKTVAKARLEPVLKSIETIAHSGKHLELTFLIVPGLNDNEVQFGEMLKWILDTNGYAIIV